MLYSTISIQDLLIETIIGVNAIERQMKQKLSINIKIFYKNQQLKNMQDNINDAYCYDHLTNVVIKFANNTQYQLLEVFGRDLYNYIKQYLSNHCTLQAPKALKISIKKYPNITNLGGFVMFEIGEKSERIYRNIL